MPGGIGSSDSDGIPEVCGDCGDSGAEERLFLHSVSRGGSCRRICTGCVLRLYHQCFCPTCFEVYTTGRPNGLSFRCVKCRSISHYLCVTEGKTPLPTPEPYVCPLCVVSDVPISESEPEKGTGVGIGDSIVSNADAAKKFIAAGKIASMSMDRAAAAAKIKAEETAMEAALKRKIATRALLFLDDLVKKEKLGVKESSDGKDTMNQQNVNKSIESVGRSDDSHLLSKSSADLDEENETRDESGFPVEQSGGTSDDAAAELDLDEDDVMSSSEEDEEDEVEDEEVGEEDQEVEEVGEEDQEVEEEEEEEEDDDDEEEEEDDDEEEEEEDDYDDDDGDDGGSVGDENDEYVASDAGSVMGGGD